MLARITTARTPQQPLRNSLHGKEHGCSATPRSRRRRKPPGCFPGPSRRDRAPDECATLRRGPRSRRKLMTESWSLQFEWPPDCPPLSRFRHSDSRHRECLWPNPWPNDVRRVLTPVGRKPRWRRGFRNGETRTRTGDTTIFRQMWADPEWAGNPCSQAGSAAPARSTRVRKLHEMVGDVGHEVTPVAQPEGSPAEHAEDEERCAT
jgi:hypothetical protein